MPQLINSNRHDHLPSRKIEKAVTEIVSTYLNALYHNDSSEINDTECDLVLSCCRLICDFRSKL